MKRSGFTMIELIFVIVILGILAAVAIPKLAATRDDAKISALATSVNTGINEIVAYVTATGSVELNLSKMSNSINSLTSLGDVTLVVPAALTAVATATVNTVPDNGGTKAACITLTRTTDLNMTVSHVTANTNLVCQGLKALVPSGQNIALKGQRVSY